MNEFLEDWERKPMIPIFKGGGRSREEEPVNYRASFQLQYVKSYWNEQPILQHLGDNEVLRNSQHGFVKNKLTTKQPNFPFFGKITGLAGAR